MNSLGQAVRQGHTLPVRSLLVAILEHANSRLQQCIHDANELIGRKRIIRHSVEPAGL